MASTKPATLLGRISLMTATVFGIGYLPIAPGTWGSLAALPIAALIHRVGGPGALFAAIAVVFVIGWLVCGRSEIILGEKDSSHLVIDEVAGMWLAVSIIPVRFDLYLLAFLAFRLADILKPWPVYWVERRFSGGLGVMLDDIAAGLYACLTVFLYYLYMG